MSDTQAQLVDDDDRARYATQMERVKLRIDEAANLLNSIHDERAVLYAAVQLRLVLEELSFASLVGNRKALEQAQLSWNQRNWDAAVKSLRRLNPEYWPRGVAEVNEIDKSEWIDIEGGLSEASVARIWGRLSAILHAKNPWDDRLNVSAEAAFVRDLISVLRLTLSSHFITLVGGAQLLFCRVWSSPIQVYLFSQQDEDS